MTHVGPNPKSLPPLSENESETALQPLEIHHLAHDLRGPLNSILGFSELLLQGIEGPLNDMQTEDMAAIYQSAQNLLLLINNVVDLSKLQAGRLTFEFGPVDLEEIFETISAYDFGSNKPPNLEIVINHQKDLPQVWADGERIEQIILALLRFAFTIKRSGEIRLTVHYDSHSLTLQIKNEGVLLPSETLNFLFELGVEVDAAGRSELGPGGLDLPLVQGIAEKHQGLVWVESDVNKGTTFYLKLPLYEGEQSETES